MNKTRLLISAGFFITLLFAGPLPADAVRHQSYATRELSLVGRSDVGAWRRNAPGVPLGTIYDSPLACATTPLDPAIVKNPNDRLGFLLSRMPDMISFSSENSFVVEKKYWYCLALVKGRFEPEYRVYAVPQVLLSEIKRSPDLSRCLNTAPRKPDPRACFSVGLVRRVADLNDGVMRIPLTAPGDPLLCIDADGDGHASLAAYGALHLEERRAMEEACSSLRKPIDDADDSDASQAPAARRTILEYLRHGPRCTSDEVCFPLYQVQFRSLGISDEDFQEKLHPIIAGSRCDRIAGECTANVCSYELTSVKVGTSALSANANIACGNDGCQSNEVRAIRRDEVSKTRFPALRWKRDGTDVTSTFRVENAQGGLSVSERSVTAPNTELGASSFVCGASAQERFQCSEHAQCSDQAQGGCQDLDLDRAPANPQSPRCQEKILTGQLLGVEDCDDNNPTVTSCTCSAPKRAAVSVWARNAPGESPTRVTAISIGDIIARRLTLVVDLDFDPGCLAKMSVDTASGAYVSRVPAIIAQPIVDVRHRGTRVMNRIFKIFDQQAVSKNLKPIALYNEGGRLQPLFGDTQPHGDFGDLPQGDDERVGTARRRFTRSLEGDPSELLESLLYDAVMDMANRGKLTERFRQWVEGAQNLTTQERRAAIDRFLSTSLRQWLIAHSSLSGNLQKRMSDHVLSDLTNLRVGVKLSDASGQSITSTLFEANENSYPITTHRTGEPNPMREEIQSATTFEDLLNLGGITREQITFLTNVVMQWVLGQDRASRNEALNAALGASSANRQKQGGAAVRLKGENTNIVSLPELDGAACGQDGCSTIASAIEQKLITAFGRIPEMSVVAFAKGVGSRIIQYRNRGLTIYFVDGQKPDWAALSTLLRGRGFLTVTAE